MKAKSIKGKSTEEIKVALAQSMAEDVWNAPMAGFYSLSLRSCLTNARCGS